MICAASLENRIPSGELAGGCTGKPHVGAWTQPQSVGGPQPSS